MALLLVETYEKNFGWYNGLVRIRVKGKDLAVDERLESTADLFSGRKWWVTEIGAISDDGETALLKLGIAGEQNGPIDYVWQTWQLQPPKLLGTGLTVANGARGTAKPAN